MCIIAIPSSYRPCTCHLLFTAGCMHMCHVQRILKNKFEMHREGVGELCVNEGLVCTASMDFCITNWFWNVYKCKLLKMINEPWCKFDDWKLKSASILTHTTHDLSSTTLLCPWKACMHIMIQGLAYSSVAHNMNENQCPGIAFTTITQSSRSRKKKEVFLMCV